MNNIDINEVLTRYVLATLSEIVVVVECKEMSALGRNVCSRFYIEDLHCFRDSIFLGDTIIFEETKKTVTFIDESIQVSWP